jgi:hypothetical protein
MDDKTTRIHLYPEAFGSRERLLVDKEGLSASTFRFESGVLGLRLKNDLGELVMLPFQGQQIWSAEFGGRPLTMTSMFPEPRPTRIYLETYGAFLLHCGVTSIGAAASPTDTYPLHGELPNAPFQQAWVLLGEDERGAFIGLSGQYHHIVAFSHNYVADPLVKLYLGSSLIDVSLTVENLKCSPMELMYLCHINFRPVDGGRLVYSALPTPEHVRVRTSIPSHIKPGPGYVEFLQSLKERPEQHHQFTPDQVYDPEVVFYMDYLADQDGWAHSMHVLPDGSADYVRHATAQLDHAIRWIVRTADQQALGFIEPATAEVEGYTAEKAKGNLKIIPPGGSWATQLRIGVLTPTEAAAVEQKIAAVLESERLK